MTQYFDVWPDNRGKLVERAEDGDRDFGGRLGFRQGRVEQWPRLHWLARNETPPDVVATVDSTRLVSGRVRDLWDTELGELDEIQWIPGTLTTPDGTDLQYWVPHFPVWPPNDIYDTRYTTWGPSGLPIRWVLSGPALAGRRVFALAESVLGVLVHEEVNQAMREAGITGARIDPARMA
jgi:hypothetical protein